MDTSNPIIDDPTMNTSEQLPVNAAKPQGNRRFRQWDKKARLQYYDRVKNVLAEKTQQLRNEIETMQKEHGGYPHDYSLGWTNAFIFILHHLNGEPGTPTFYDQKTSIGEVPRPVRFQHKTEEDALDEAEHHAKVDDIIDAVRKFVAAKPGKDESAKAYNEMAHAMYKFDEFLDRLAAKEETNERT
jgi:hypothetical protein